MCEQKYKGSYHFIFCFVIATLHEEVSIKGEGREKKKELPSSPVSGPRISGAGCGLAPGGEAHPDPHSTAFGLGLTPSVIGSPKVSTSL